MRAGLLTAVALWLSTCAPVPLGDGEKRTVVREITTVVVLPALDEVVVRAAALTTATENLAAAPSPEDLDAAQEAWRAARVPWKETEAFAFGPAMELRLAVAIDQSPVDAPKIDQEIAGTAPLTEAYVETLGANRKGFHAIEILLFGGDDEAVLAALTTGDGAARRRDLLVAFASNLERKAGELQAAWAPGGGDYAARITEPGSRNASYPTIQSVVDTLVNESVFLSELVADARLGKPMGTASGGDPRPELEESGPSDNSIADMAGELRGIRNVYLGTRTGTDGTGIGQLVLAQSPATDRAVRDALGRAIDALESIPRPYRDALDERRPEVTAAYDAVKALKRILATEVVGVLGATLKFNENDGD